MTKLVKENINHFAVDIAVESHPRSDRKIIDLLSEYYDNVKFAGGVGRDNIRVISVNDQTATVEDVSDILFKYIENGTVVHVDYV